MNQREAGVAKSVSLATAWLHPQLYTAIGAISGAFGETYDAGDQQQGGGGKHRSWSLSVVGDWTSSQHKSGHDVKGSLQADAPAEA